MMVRKSGVASEKCSFILSVTSGALVLVVCVSGDMIVCIVSGLCFLFAKMVNIIHFVNRSCV